MTTIFAAFLVKFKDKNIQDFFKIDLLFHLPQAWAVFKGKFKEGDKAEPATWKTRLRCALNKSPDFEEVAERSQLDISDPYKVYRIVPEEEQKRESFFLVEVLTCGVTRQGVSIPPFVCEQQQTT